MARTLQAPAALTDLPYFVLRYDREGETYELGLPGTRETHVLGTAEKVRAYFKRVGLEEIGGRAMDAALAFGASQALLKEPRRAFGLDLTDPRIDALVGRRDQELTRDRLLGTQDDDEVIVI